MYKNVTLRPRTVDGKPTWKLLGPDGLPIAAFDAFAKALHKDPLNTRKAYCRHLAEFLDYLIEAYAVIGQGRTLTKLELTEAIEAYGDYLRLGVDAGNDIARAVAESLPPGANAPGSVIPKKAAVRRFLKLNDSVRKELAELARLRPSATQVAGETLLPELNARRELKPYEVRALQAHSMLAGVVADGPKFVDVVVLDDDDFETEYDERRAFPYDKVMDFIDAVPTYRDKALYSLLAASGGRTHEGLQTLVEDVDVVEGTVRLVNPKAREGHASYRALTAEQRAQLAWKGRTTQLTLLIEPFASAFFDALQKYLEREHLPHGRHDFLFQYLTPTERGAPYFLSRPSTRLELFHKVCKHVGVILPPGTGPHSLRHMYGTYALNYFPRANGEYGLPLPMVQQLLGHADPKSTLKYARYDKDLLKLEVQHANRVLFRAGTPKKLLQLKLEALEAQVAKVRNQMVQEALSHG
jgi:integrase